MSFSWTDAIKEGLEMKIDYEKRKVRALVKPSGRHDKEYKDKHPVWFREASQGKYDTLIKELTEENNKRMKMLNDRRTKKHESIYEY